MKILDTARRLLSAGALVLLAGLAVSIMTHDAWLLVGHVAGGLGAVMSAVAALVLLAAGLRRLAPPSPKGDEEAIMPHERGLTDLEADARADPGPTP